MRLGDEGHTSDMKVGVGSTGVEAAIGVGDALGVCAGVEVGVGDSSGWVAVGRRVDIVVVGFVRVPLGEIVLPCGMVTVGMPEACLCSLRSSAIRMIARITKTSNLKRSYPRA
jgi:hypothetical protein